MYKAIAHIGGYKPGDIIPDDKAKLWLEMYSIPQVELVSDKPLVKEKPKDELDLDKDGDVDKDDGKIASKVSNRLKGKKKGKKR